MLFCILYPRWFVFNVAQIFISPLPCRHMAQRLSATSSTNTLWPKNTSIRSLWWWSISIMWTHSQLDIATYLSLNPSLQWPSSLSRTIYNTYNCILTSVSKCNKERNELSCRAVLQWWRASINALVWWRWVILYRIIKW